MVRKRNRERRDRHRKERETGRKRKGAIERWERQRE